MIVGLFLSNERGQVRLKCLYSSVIHRNVLLVEAGHSLVNQLITFTPTDMGEVITGFEGMPFNNIYVQIQTAKT